MSEWLLSEETIRNIQEMTQALQGRLKKANPISALLMDDIFQDSEENDGHQALITFDGEILMFENRQNADVWVALTDTELWQIIAFALDNGLQLPQNEDDNESGN